MKTSTVSKKLLMPWETGRKGPHHWASLSPHSEHHRHCGALLTLSSNASCKLWHRKPFPVTAKRTCDRQRLWEHQPCHWKPFTLGATGKSILLKTLHGNWYNTNSRTVSSQRWWLLAGDIPFSKDSPFRLDCGNSCSYGNCSRTRLVSLDSCPPWPSTPVMAARRAIYQSPDINWALTGYP